MGFTEFFHQFKADARWRYAIMAVNLGGIAYGFYYYMPQFFGAPRLDVPATPWYLWIFVPDSPLAVLWAELALLLYCFGKRSAIVDALAVVANVKVGLWTAWVMFQHDLLPTSDLWTMVTHLNFTLFWLHLGMVALAFIFLHDLRGAGWRVVAGIGAWLLVNDWMDYAFAGYESRGCVGLRPYTVDCDGIGLTALVTVGLTVAVVALLAAFALQSPPGGRAGATRARAAEVAAGSGPREP